MKLVPLAAAIAAAAGDRRCVRLGHGVGRLRRLKKRPRRPRRRSRRSPTEAGTIGVILQSTAASGRWESQDRPRLLDNIKAFAPNAEVVYSNGEGKARTS